MKKHYIALWALLAVAFLFFALLPELGMPTLFGHTLKEAGIRDALFSERTVAEALDPDTIISTDVDESSLFPVPCDTASQTILFVGDSMLEGLGPRLAAYAEKNGHTLYNVIWYSSTSERWGNSDKLRHYIDQIKPTYIFICLGANELFVSDIAEKRRQFVRNIISDIDTIPYVWIGPPNWKPDTGINDLIAENTRKGSFFLSNGMHFDRSKDGAHPTRSSAALWMDSVARWMPGHSFHPIMMELPDKASGRPKRVFVHQPNEK